ncbi:MAG: hypothetical protein E7397_03315 [Ruminococcaceae bacterium]|nr:hypothetical protein [Oscillospiraceae bacterium]
MKQILKAGLVLMLAMFFVPTAFAANAYYKDIPGWAESFMSYPTDIEFLEEWGVHLVRDAAIVPSGDAAISISIQGGAANAHHANAAQSVAIEDGKTYKVSGKFYIPAKSWRYSLKIGERAFAAGDGVLGTTIGSWTDFEYVLHYKASDFANSKQFRLTANSPGSGAMYADDLSIKEIIYEEDGETISGYGEELLVNGDFETDLDWTAPGEVTELVAENMDSSVRLSWKNPLDADLKKIEIYNITGGRNQLLATVTDSEVFIENLVNEEVYTLLVCTKDNWENTSDGIEIEVKPVPDATKVGEPAFVKEGEQVTARMQFKNNAMPEDYSVEMIFVLYKDGAVYDIQSAYQSVQPSEFYEPYTEVSVSLAIPQGDEYSAVLYVWDSVTGMEALSKAYTFGE